MKKLLFAAIAVLVAVAASAKGSETAAVQGKLRISRNSTYWIDGVRISREDLLNRVTPSVPGLAEQIMKGVKMKRAAIGLGISGGVMFLGGFFTMAVNSGHESPDPQPNASEGPSLQGWEFAILALRWD